MPKWLKLLIGLALLPAAAGVTLAVARVVQAARAADEVWVALAAGMACWLVISVLLPAPQRAYILGHELTHAAWSLLFGGRVKSLKVAGQHGRVVVTKTNALVTLAPYFFPLYAVIVLAVFQAADRLWDWRGVAVYFHLLLGAAYGFHLTFTVAALRSKQPDVASQGWLFSLAVIWLGNGLVLLLGLAVLTGRVEASTALGWAARETVGLLGLPGLRR
jgi:hypothetical protein